jgi:hypothetical protein
MNCEWWCAVVPGVTEVVLVGCCLLVWFRLRQLGVSGVCQWALVVIGLDAMAQGHALYLRLGHPAGVTWLLHTALSYTVVYVLYRAGELLWQLRTACTSGAMAEESWVEASRGRG